MTKIIDKISTHHLTHAAVGIVFMILSGAFISLSCNNQILYSSICYVIAAVCAFCAVYLLFGAGELYQLNQQEELEEGRNEYRKRFEKIAKEEWEGYLKKSVMAFGENPQQFPEEKRNKLALLHLKHLAHQSVGRPEAAVKLVDAISRNTEISTEEATYFVESIFRDFSQENLAKK
jgi:hypothetical protein